MAPRNKTASELDPFTTLSVRAVVSCTPEEQAVLVAIQLLHWWMGPEAKGLDLIMAVLIDPDRKKLPAEDPAFQSQISEKGIKRALASLRKRELVVTERITNSMGYRSPMGFKLTVPAMTFKEAYALILTRLKIINPRLWATLAPKGANDGQPSLFEQPPTPALTPPTAPPPAGTPGAEVPHQLRKKDQDTIWAHWKAGYIAKYKQPPVWPNFKWVGPAIAALTANLGVVEICRRMDNMLGDPFINGASFGDFLAKPDKWVTKREPFEKGGKNARTFTTPTVTDFTPSGHGS